MLKELTFNDERDRTVMVIIMDHKTAYLSDAEQEKITREFYPGTLCDVDCTRLSEPRYPEWVVIHPAP